MLQVELIVRAERSTILLPTSLVGSSAYTFDEEDTFNKAVSLSVPEIQLQLRLHDYYMGTYLSSSCSSKFAQLCSEMSLNYDRITASIFQDSAGQITPTTPHEILVIDGVYPFLIKSRILLIHYAVQGWTLLQIVYSGRNRGPLYMYAYGKLP